MKTATLNIRLASTTHAGTVPACGDEGDTLSVVDGQPAWGPGGGGSSLPAGSFAGQPYFWDGASAVIPVVPEATYDGETSPQLKFNVWENPPGGADSLYAVSGGLFRVNAATTISFVAAAGAITLNPSTAITCSGKPIQAVANPTNAQDVATKDYVDTLAANLGSGGFGLYASRPSPAVGGRTYIASDSPIANWVDDGALWRPVISGVVCYEVPNISSFNSQFSAYNSGTGLAVSGGNGVLYLQGATADATLISRGWAISSSGSSAWIECSIDDTVAAAGGVGLYTTFGIGIRLASTGAMLAMTSYRNDGVSYNVHAIDARAWTSNTAGTSINKYWSTIGDAGGPTFYKVRRSGSDLVAEVSKDRQLWIEVTRTSGVGMGDQLVVTASAANVTAAGKATLKHLAWSA